MATLQLSLSAEEVRSELHYDLLCEVRSSVRWQTGRRRRLWEQTFDLADRQQAERIFAACRRMCLTSGPRPLTMDISTYDLWMRLVAFCGSL